MKRVILWGYSLLCVLCLWTSVNRQPIQQTTAADEYYCLLKEYNGKIGVYGADHTLMDIIDYPYVFLNDHDRLAMKEGVPIQSEEDLQKRIEDYTS